MKIYLAGPLGFSEAGRSYQDGTLVPAIKRLGYEVLDPDRHVRIHERKLLGHHKTFRREDRSVRKVG